MEHFELFDFTIQLTQHVVEEVDFDGSNDSIEGIMSHKYHNFTSDPKSPRGLEKLLLLLQLQVRILEDGTDFSG